MPHENPLALLQELLTTIDSEPERLRVLTALRSQGQRQIREQKYNVLYLKAQKKIVARRMSIQRLVKKAK